MVLTLYFTVTETAISLLHHQPRVYSLAWTSRCACDWGHLKAFKRQICITEKKKKNILQDVLFFPTRGTSFYLYCFCVKYFCALSNVSASRTRLFFNFQKNPRKNQKKKKKNPKEVPVFAAWDTCDNGSKMEKKSQCLFRVCRWHIFLQEQN